MKIHQNIELKKYTSMYVGGKARYFTEIETEEDIPVALKFARENNLPYFVLGAGSNTLVSDAGFSGLVMRMRLMGRHLKNETDVDVLLEVGSGENWDDFVKFTTNNNLYGIENMSHVPGSVGASVVQNIGCYGEEVSESVVSVTTINTETLEKVTFLNADIFFSYRKSRFNDPTGDKGKYIITSVIFRLQKHGTLNMKYDDIKKYFNENMNIVPNLQTIREAIIHIRNNKFPFPDRPTNGTAGSFWNIPVVDGPMYESIITKLKTLGFKTKAEEMRSKKSVFTVAQGYKLAPGLFIEVLGFKGKSHGGAKILENHAGIINNFTGKATAHDVFELSEEVRKAVYEEFGVTLNIEPELVGDFGLSDKS